MKYILSFLGKGVVVENIIFVAVVGSLQQLQGSEAAYLHARTSENVRE